MAAKKKAPKKRSKSKRSAAGKVNSKKKTGKKKAPLKKLAQKRVVAKAQGKKKSGLRTVSGSKSRAGNQTTSSPFSRARDIEGSGGESGDLQGLSRIERADSESVDELIEEGNPFEAEAVAGVEAADDADGREVHTHEVPEDDVPDEYLDKE